MDPQSIPNSPEISTGYMPYFYKRGLFVFYPVQQNHPVKSGSSGGYAGYDFTSDLTRPSRHSRGQSVEQIIYHGYLSIPESDLTTSLISDRRHTSWLGLDDIISQVRGRYQLYDQNMYEMEWSKCYASNALFSLVASRGSLPPTSKEVYSVTKKIQDLYEQQREERVNLWKDISRLKLSLPEIVQQYLSAYRKMGLLQEANGDDP